MATASITHEMEGCHHWAAAAVYLQSCQQHLTHTALVCIMQAHSKAMAVIWLAGMPGQQGCPCSTYYLEGSCPCILLTLPSHCIHACMGCLLRLHAYKVDDPGISNPALCSVVTCLLSAQWVHSISSYMASLDVSGGGKCFVCYFTPKGCGVPHSPGRLIDASTYHKSIIPSI